MSATEVKRVEIPTLCFVRKAGSALHCTELKKNHPKDHYHCYTKTSWPRRGGDAQ